MSRPASPRDRKARRAIAGVDSRARAVLTVLVLTQLLAGGACARNEDPGSTRTVRVAAVQFDARPEEPGKNLLSVERLARSAAGRGARVVLFHENTLMDYGERVGELAEPVPEGPASRSLASTAVELGIWIGVGLAERAGDDVFVTHAWFGPGGFLGSARKSHLFANPGDPRRDEPAHFEPGAGPSILHVAGIRTATLICSDEDSPELVREIRALEPELVFFPNNRSALPRPESFGELARQLDAPLVLANRSGRSWQYACNGGSCILDREGTVLGRAERDGSEEILVVDVEVPGDPAPRPLDGG